MQTRIRNLKHAGPLGQALPHAQFAEHHAITIDADRGTTWQILHDLRWSDLTVTKLFTFVRSAGRVRRLDVRLVEPPSPGTPLEECRPDWSASGMIGKPWHPVPVRGPDPVDLADLAAFDEPGWLKYGMQWQLEPLSGGRTRLTTTTLCEATDRQAQLAFTAYWVVIRLFSGLIRRDILAAVARRAATTAATNAETTPAATPTGSAL